MTAGLMQLVTYGSQDVYLTGNPQITYFKVVYRRHTNFAIETLEQTFIGNINFGNKVTAIFKRNADLINKMYIKVVLSEIDPQGSNFAWVKRLGHAIISQVDIEIGGTIIDRQYGTWLDIWYELARRGNHERGYKKLIGETEELIEFNTLTKPEYEIYIPLKFWFNRFVGLSIPLIALQYHDVRVHVEFNKKEKLIIRDNEFDDEAVKILNASLLVNYIYLDTEERRRFAQVGHEYLIEQLQFIGEEKVLEKNKIYRIDYNHPVKEIIWVMQKGEYITGKRFIYYTHRDKWDEYYKKTDEDDIEYLTTEIIEASKKIIKESISVNDLPDNEGEWIEVETMTSATIGTLNIKNNYESSVYVNIKSLEINGEYLIDKINADITINELGMINVDEIESDLTVRYLSIPHERMIDTRYNPQDAYIYMHHNYGLLIDGTVNPIKYGQIKFNGHNRFDRREGNYFNYIQPLEHHSNTPADGINVYSFSLYPEEHQPSGTANLSRIDETVLELWFNDNTLTAFDTDLPDINLLNEDNKLLIYGTNYNILRIMSGMAALAYVMT